MIKKKQITDQQKLFVQNYVANGLDREKAARDAGYKGKPRSLAVTTCNLLQMPHIIDYKNELMSKVEDECVAGVSEILMRLTNIGRRKDMESVVVTLTHKDSDYNSKGRKITTERQTAEVVEVPNKTADANKALELIGKYHDMWATTSNINITMPVFEGENELED
ncbi:MAG: terminase small subunit [Bacillota bacterium]